MTISFRRSRDGRRKAEVGGRKSEGGSRRAEVGSRRAEVGGRRTEGGLFLTARAREGSIGSWLDGCISTETKCG